MSSSMDNNYNLHKDMKNKLIYKVIPIVRKNGFQSLRMEEISKYMDVSKATMYKYFSSKEEIIQSVVEMIIHFIDELLVESYDAIESFGAVFQQLFEQSIILAAYISDGFLNELQAAYPELYDRLTDAMKQREGRILNYYQAGKSKGVFNAFNENLIFLQDHVLMRAMLDMKFLMLHHMTLNQAIMDYYQLMKLQLFRAEQLPIVDDTVMTAKADYIAHKITRDLL